jgi:hypothetical protein
VRAVIFRVDWRNSVGCGGGNTTVDFLLDETTENRTLLVSRQDSIVLEMRNSLGSFSEDMFTY